MECPDCGFVFTQGVPDEKEIGRYYDSPDYISHSNTDKGFINKIYHIVRSVMLRKKVKLIERLTLLKNGKLYHIPKDKQEDQARRAGIDISFEKGEE